MAEANRAKKLAPNSELGASFLGTPAKPHLPVFAVLLSQPRLFWHLGELRDLRMVSSSMTELVGGLRLSGLLGSTKCPKCDACGSASAIIPTSPETQAWHAAARVVGTKRGTRPLQTD